MASEKRTFGTLELLVIVIIPFLAFAGIKSFQDFKEDGKNQLKINQTVNVYQNNH